MNIRANMNIRVIVADDEALARERLRHLLAAECEVEIVTECRNGREAAAYLAKNSADLLLLDIQMPGMGGFALLESLGSAPAPLVVFTTAHQDYARQAFDINAVDYLTKPIEAERLALALARVRDRLAARAALKTQAALQGVMTETAPVAKQRSYSRRLLVPNGGADVLVDVEEIDWIEAADYYACIHIGKRTLLLRETMKELAETLDPDRFVRIHRSVIVPIARVREVLREARGDGAVVLRSGERLKMSKPGWEALLAASQSFRDVLV